jgi:hypothetical protein
MASAFKDAADAVKLSVDNLSTSVDALDTAVEAVVAAFQAGNPQELADAIAELSVTKDAAVAAQAKADAEVVKINAALPPVVAPPVVQP